MNERIKQLAVEADFMLCEDGHFYSEGQSQKITDYLQKFAELIVRECLKQVRDEVQYLADWDKADEVINSVKKHFGVSDE